MEPSNNITVIKKYPNRNMYDPITHTYCTYIDLVGRIKAGEKLKIVVQVGNKDITKFTYVQILAQQERAYLMNLSEEELEARIRNDVRPFAGKSLSASPSILRQASC